MVVDSMDQQPRAKVEDQKHFILFSFDFLNKLVVTTRKEQRSWTNKC